VVKKLNNNSLDLNDGCILSEVLHKAIDDSLSYLNDIDNKNVFHPLRSKDYTRFEEDLPWDSLPLQDSYEFFNRFILERHSPMNLHPGFYGWAMGGGNPVGILGGMLENMLNANVIGGMQISCLVEEQVLRWAKQLFCLPEIYTGLITGGCSEANLIALTVARNSKMPGDIPRKGLYDQPRSIFYASEQTHVSIHKALNILGVGDDNIRSIPVNEKYEIIPYELEKAIIEDLKLNYCPTGIIANCGSINTGAIDDISALSQIAKEYNIWLHVDGAFGVFAMLTDSYHYCLESLSLADSISFDFHKWMNMPYSSGCVLIKDRKTHYEAFQANGGYIEHSEPWFSDYGIALSRRFSALSIWLCLKTYGVRQIIDCVNKNIEQAKYLYQKMKNQTDWEMIMEPTLNVVCMRYVYGSDQTIMNEINKSIVSEINMKGRSFVTTTNINDCIYIRVCIINHRTTEQHINLLIQDLIEVGVKKRQHTINNNIIK